VFAILRRGLVHGVTGAFGTRNKAQSFFAWEPDGQFIAEKPARTLAW
jgi:hypothetical protein